MGLQYARRLKTVTIGMLQTLAHEYAQPHFDVDILHFRADAILHGRDPFAILLVLGV